MAFSVVSGDPAATLFRLRSTALRRDAALDGA
jgi:hypothetical protein